MRWVLAALLIALLVTSPVIAKRAGEFVSGKGISQAYSMLDKLETEGKVPKGVKEIVLQSPVVATFEQTGNDTQLLSFKGLLNGITIVINGNGSEFGRANQTSFEGVDNGTSIYLNFTYYPRSVKIKFEGFEWWSSNYQHIINGSGNVIATISETDGSWSINDDYTTVNPIWDSIGANITVNTTAGRLEHTPDTAAETVSVIYNITIDDGYFTSMTWNNVSVYVAANTTAGTGQDDLNIYYSTDGGTTWNIIFDAADGSTSTGTQWTGDVNLPISGNSTVLIKIEFVSDGADDDAANADVYIDTISITGTVSKLPTRNPKIDLNGDGTWDASYSGSLTNGSSSSEILLGDLNLTNTISVYAEGSERVTLNFTWFDEGRIKLFSVSVAGVNVSVDKYLASGENETIFLTNFTDIIPPINMSITIDTKHTITTSYNYTISIYTYPFMLMSDCLAEISPDDGAHYVSYKPYSEPIPVFVKPRSAPVSVNVNVYYPEAGIGDTLLNMTVSSAVHDNVVDIVVTDISVPQVDLYIDGEFVKTITVNESVVYFNLTGFSDKTVTLVVSGSLATAPPEIDVQWLVSVAMLITLFAVLIYIGVATLRGK